MKNLNILKYPRYSKAQNKKQYIFSYWW